MKISFSKLQTLSRAAMSASAADGSTAASRRRTLEAIDAVTAASVVFVSDALDSRASGNSSAETVHLRDSRSHSPFASVAHDGADEVYEEMVANKLLSESLGATRVWFRNHFRWVVWKLAAMELAFPLFLSGKYLTKAQVMLQIQRRYQTDLCSVRRSIVKKVLHRDASPVSCMVLCVAAVLPCPVGRNEHADLTLPAHWNLGLVLTDGWYSVYAVADLALGEAMWRVHTTRGLVGSKLVVWNAQLQNSTDGVDPLECAVTTDPWRHPLEETEDLSRWPYLKLQFNSTRRAAFGTPLGLERVACSSDSAPRSKGAREPSVLGFELLKGVPMRTLEVSGGMARAVRVVILRISPVLHLQAKDQTLGPRILCDEHLSLYYEARAEIARLRRGADHESEHEQFERAMEGYGALDALDTPLPTPFVKFDVLCTHELALIERGEQPRCFGVLTLWRPSQDLLAGYLRESCEYFVSNLTVNWKIAGGATSPTFLRLSTTKGSRFELADSGDREESGQAPRTERLAALTRTLQTRACVSVSDAIEQHRAAAEDGSVSSERRLVVDVCVYVLQTSDVTPVDEPAKRDAKAASADDSGVTTEQKASVEHVFVTDASARIMSIRVASTSVSIALSAAALAKKKTQKRANARRRAASFVFRRGARSVWSEGSVVCITGLEVSHYDEHLGVLDCTLVESSRVTTHPSKTSHLHEPFLALKRQLAAATTVGSGDAAGGGKGIASMTSELKKYVDRRILQMDFVPTQHETEAERLTQDFTAHELCFVNDAAVERPSEPMRAAWTGSILKLMAMPNAKSGFPQEIVALAIFEVVSARKTATPLKDRVPQLKTVYFSRALALAFLDLLRGAATQKEPTRKDDEHLSDSALVANVLEWLGDRDCGGEFASTRQFCVEARRETNERLLNSVFDWERLHASYWSLESIALDSSDASDS